jgi:hypothetical protein
MSLFAAGARGAICGGLCQERTERREREDRGYTHACQEVRGPPPYGGGVLLYEGGWIYAGGGGLGMDSDVNGRPRRGAPRMRRMRMTSSVDGLGVERGPVDAPNWAFHVQNLQTRAINIAGPAISIEQTRRGGEGEDKKDRPPKRTGQKMRLNLRPAAAEGGPPPPLMVGTGCGEPDTEMGDIRGE